MTDNTQPDDPIAVTDYAKPLFCSGCDAKINVDNTIHVADFGSAFPTFCSGECATDEAEEYRVKHLVDEHDGTEFVRIIERNSETEITQ